MQCIVSHLGIQSERLAQQRKIKVSQCQDPILKLTKEAVADQKLTGYVVYPSFAVISSSIEEWWKGLGDDQEVEVKYAYERHGLAGKVSNHAKTSVIQQFLDFVDVNSHPNGRPLGSYSPQFFFILKFTRIDLPKPGEKDHDSKANSSVVATFNSAQLEAGRQPFSAFAAHQWLSTHRSKVALHPHKSEYCDTCKGLKEDISQQSATFKRLMQAGSTPEADLQAPISHVETHTGSKLEGAQGGSCWWP